MIAIKNADGTLVPVIDSSPGANRAVALSLVHSHQKRAEILLYELQGSLESPHVRDLDQPEPFGKLVLRHLPDNPFGEVEIQANLNIDQEMRLHVSAEAAGEKPVKGNFRIPSAGLGQAERQDQMTNNAEPDGEFVVSGPSRDENEAALVYSDDLFDPNFETDFLPDEDALRATETEPLLVAPEEPASDSVFDYSDLPETAFELPEVAFDPLEDLPPPMEDLATDLSLPPTTSKSEVFLHDPEDMDWGFDELANPDDAEAVPEDISALDASFDTDVARAIPAPDSFNLEEGFVDLNGSNDKLDFPIDDVDLEASRIKPESRAKKAPKAKPLARQPAKSLPKAGSEQGLKPDLAQKLLRASAVLFLVSLIEIGLFFLLRLQLI